MLAVLAAAISAGCSGGGSKPIVPAKGKIAYADGTTLPPGTRLLFNPTEGGMGTASGETAADGSFELTHVSGSSGAEVGKYTVSLLAPEGAGKEFFSRIPPGYADGSTLSAEVKDGMPPLAFTVPKPKKK